jgi:PKD repeat protein
MKTQFRVLLLSSVVLAMTGCQKSGTDTAAELNVTEGASVALKSCQSGPSQNVTIEGLENLKSGQKTRLSLSSGVNCDDAASALWKVGNTLIGSGGTVEAEIMGSGNYVVSVEIPVGSQSQNKMAAKATTQSISIQQSITVTDSGVMVSGPQAGTADVSYNFSLAIPAGVQLASAQWDFGDGSPIENSLATRAHTFSEGVYQIKVKLTRADGVVENLQHQITLLPVPEGRYCALDQMAIVGATEVPALRPVDFSVNLSDCLKSVVTRVQWTFGDQSPLVSGSTASHTYQTEGVYTVSAQVSLNGTSVTLIREITVSENLETMPGPVPAPNPNRCVGSGTTRVVDGNVSTETQACGVDGSKEMTYREQITQQCSLVGEGLEWVEVSRSKVLVSEGQCSGQSCSLVTESGTEVLKNGESRTLYSSKSPVGACQDVQVIRTCANGVLSGSDTAKFLSCQSGCGDFGVNGTVKTGVVIGEISVPVTCKFGEEGITSVYSQIADKTCNNGSVVTSNTRQGDVKTAGACPVYSWVATDQYTACSASCGGTQSRQFECRNANGVVSPAERCESAMPVETRVCDGDPNAVAKVETAVTSEQAPSCATCPKNQIGVVVKERTVTTLNTTACVDHKIQTTAQVTNGAWVEEKYCRDLTPARCSQDSLSNPQAHGRYDWMVKCQDQVPVIKEFLAELNDVKYQSFGLNTPGRVLYPTFMNSATKKPWIAPKTKDAACVVPESAYVAGVCVSSCATPEQQILVEQEKKLKYMPFIDALTQKIPVVATLQSNSTMASKTVAKTQVDAWVTEMFDGDHDILVFNMKSGGQLKLTTNHPILAQNGVMKMSSEFKVGESLVQLGGKLDPIVSIEKAVHHGKVYNLFVKSSALQKNVVVTNGYLNGTAFYQNEGTQFLNRALFRERMIRGAFPEEKK